MNRDIEKEIKSKRALGIFFICTTVALTAASIRIAKKEPVAAVCGAGSATISTIWARNRFKRASELKKMQNTTE